MEEHEDSELHLQVLGIKRVLLPKRLFLHLIGKRKKRTTGTLQTRQGGDAVMDSDTSLDLVTGGPYPAADKEAIYSGEVVVLSHTARCTAVVSFYSSKIALSHIRTGFFQSRCEPAGGVIVVRATWGGT